VTATTEELDPELSPWKLAGPERRARRRRLLLALLVLFTLVTTFIGFPTGREVILGWVLLALLAACGGDVRLWRRAVVRDWLPLFFVLFAYDLLRGIANEVGGRLFGLPSWVSSAEDPAKHARAHLTPMIEGDRALFGGSVPTTWLQDHYYELGTAHWYDVVAALVYLSHFLVPLGLAVVLWCLSYQLFRRYLAVFVALTLAGLATYVLYPAVPPWMAALNGHLPPVHRVVSETLQVIGGDTVSSAVEQGAAYSNPVAAMPSLHAAMPMMLLVFFWPAVRWLARGVLVAYALTMAVTLVYTGEHYVTDVLAGWLYAAVVVLVARVVVRQRAPG
jgi:membrane-associated phospholipid phosphatase